MNGADDRRRVTNGQTVHYIGATTVSMHHRGRHLTTDSRYRSPLAEVGTSWYTYPMRFDGLISETRQKCSRRALVTHQRRDGHARSLRFLRTRENAHDRLRTS